MTKKVNIRNLHKRITDRFEREREHRFKLRELERQIQKEKESYEKYLADCRYWQRYQMYISRGMGHGDAEFRAKYGNVVEVRKKSSLWELVKWAKKKLEKE